MNLSGTFKLLFRNPFNYVILPNRPKAIHVVSQITGQSMMVSAQRFNDRKMVLQNFGFNASQADQILKEQSDILMLSKTELSASFSKFYRFKIEEGRLLKIVASCPRLLLLDAVSLETRIKELMTLFTQKDILNLLKNCPQVYYENFDVTLEKVQYLLHFMGVEQRNIIKSGALKLDLTCIQLRHNFLLYTGKFKKPTRKIQFKNPPLDKILHKDVYAYLQLSGLTLEEYDTYESMFDKLLIFDEVVGEGEEESDDEDDEENDNEDEEEEDNK